MSRGLGTIQKKKKLKGKNVADLKLVCDSSEISKCQNCSKVSVSQSLEELYWQEIKTFSTDTQARKVKRWRTDKKYFIKSG